MEIQDARVERMEKIYDLIIIGAGPAGLTASIYASRAGLDFIVIDKSFVAGGQIMNTYEIENYPGLDLLSGMELSAKFSEHAERLGMEMLNEEVENIENTAEYKIVTTSENVYKAKNIILATGANHRLLKIEGEEKLKGRGVSYCATCDGAFFREKTALVVGGGDVAVEDAMFLARFCKKVYLVHRRDSLRAAKILQNKLFEIDKIEVVWDTVPLEIIGDTVVTGLKVRNVKTNEESVIDTDAVFVAVGIVPATENYKDLLELNDGGYIVTDKYCQSSVPGIYACGDIRDTPLRQVITAAADGAIAVSSMS